MEDYEEAEIVSNGTVNGIQIAAHNSEVVSRYSRVERDPSLFSNEPASYLVSLLFDGKWKAGIHEKSLGDDKSLPPLPLRNRSDDIPSSILVAN